MIKRFREKDRGKKGLRAAVFRPEKKNPEKGME